MTGCTGRVHTGEDCTARLVGLEKCIQEIAQEEEYLDTSVFMRVERTRIFSD
jgi:hypothetical protein